MKKLTLLEVRSKAVALIALHVGSVTAKMYDDLYSKKNAEYIYTSINSVMTELLGTQKAKKELKRVSLTH